MAAAAPELRSDQSEASQPLLLNAPDYSGEALQSEAEAGGELTQRQASTGAPAGPAGRYEGAGADASNAAAAEALQPQGLSRRSEGSARGVDEGEVGAAEAARVAQGSLGRAFPLRGTTAASFPSGKEAPEPRGAGSSKPGSSTSHSWPKLAARSPHTPLSPRSPRSWGGSPRSAASGGSRGGGGAKHAQQDGYSWRATIPAIAACTACLFVQVRRGTSLCIWLVGWCSLVLLQVRKYLAVACGWLAGWQTARHRMR